jgi:hypothetical protein
MSRVNARNVLVVTVVGLGVCSLLPGRMLRWAGHGRDIAITLTAPMQQPLRWLATVGRAEERVDEGVTVESLMAQLDEAQLQIARLASDKEELERMVRELQSGQLLGMDRDVRRFAAYVIGGGDAVNGSLMKVRAGSRQGVVPRSSIAVLNGVDLVGRVVDVAAGHCLVQPITDKNAGTVWGAIMLDDGTPGPGCTLSPAGDGTLFGRMGTDAPEGQPGWTPRPGMVVRVDDAGWPAAAQMRIIGRIEKVEPSPDQPLHKRITVRPAQSIEQATLVVLMMPDQATAGWGEGDGAGAVSGADVDGGGR